MNLVKSNSVFSPIGQDIFFSNFQDTVQRLFDSGPSIFSSDRHLNISETDDEFAIELALPGVSKEELEISIDNELLEVRTNLDTKNEKTTKHYHLQNLATESIQRKFQLPQNIDRKSIKAELKNGLLNISLPKGKGDKVQKIKIS